MMVRCMSVCVSSALCPNHWCLDVSLSLPSASLAATVSLAQREESACMCRTPSPVHAPANTHNCNASPDNLS